MSDRRQTICLLPWLELTERVEFGRLKLDRFENVGAQLEPEVAVTAARIAAGFRDLRSEAVNASICWLSDRGPTDEIAEEEIDVVRDHLLLGMIAAIAENPYFSRHAQINATHFHRVYQNFVADTETVALVLRRREGTTFSSGWKIDELRFSVPAAAQTRPTPQWKQPFLDALGTCIGADDELSVRILDSAVWFFQGCELDENERHNEDVVFLVSALEQLVGISGGRQDTQMAAKLIESLGQHWDDPANRWVRKWMTEAYKKRSELHGGRADAVRWPYWGHALLVTIAFSLMTKSLLAQEGRYALDDEDQVAIEAFPRHIECVTLEDEDGARDIAACWRDAAGSAAMRCATRRAFENLQTHENTEDAATGG